MMVSVIIPVYNDSAWLERAVNSALIQRDGEDMEIILIDNNSTDASLQLCHDLRARYPETIVVGNAARQGSAAARNEGLRLARGEWINFLDADDIFLPGKIARQLSLAGENTDWVIQAYYDQALNGKRVLSGLNDDHWKGLVHNAGLGCTNSHLLRKHLLESIGGQDEELPNGPDVDMNFRLLQTDPVIVSDPEPGSVYIDRSGPRLSSLPGRVSHLRGVRLKAAANKWLAEYKPAYFETHKAFFRTALLNAIRQSATLNLEQAAERFCHHFPEGLPASEMDKSIAPRLAVLYPIFGFFRVEFVRKLMGRFILRPIKQKMKGS